jgi:hypothetical protein
MITIDNTKVKHAGTDVTYCDYLLQITEHIPYQQGLTRENIKLELKVIETLESQKEKEQLSIDDSYVQYLKEKELNMTWIIREKWLVEFGETLQNIKI